MEPQVINGGVSIDDRGELNYFNDFDFAKIKRFYVVQNHKAGFVRAWHGHQKEAKYAYVVKGAALFGVRPITDNDAEITAYALAEKQPQMLYIPPGFYNGFKTLTDDTVIIFYSTATLAQSKKDDMRQPANTWNIWMDSWR